MAGGKETTDRITQLLLAHRDGDRDAFDRLLPVVYQELKKIARRQLGGGSPRQTLATTALVHEAWFQLVDEKSVDWADRAHFFAIASRAMRRIVVDHIRRAVAQKRGGDMQRVPLEAASIPVAGEEAGRILALDEALERLASFNERLSQLVECRFFGGMTEEETAAALGVSLRTVQRDWTRARAWLHRALGES